MAYNIKDINIKSLVADKLFDVDINPNGATKEQVYKASALVINSILRQKRKEFSTKAKEQDLKRVYYLSMEFLMGKSLKNNIYNLGLTKQFEEMANDYGFTLEDLYEIEPDAALGNGGLGRLGACFLDSLAALNYPAMGFSLRYEYGIFKQKIVDGWQTELPDIWLPGGEVWLIKRDDSICSVKMGGHIIEHNDNGKVTYEYKDYKEIQAVPYDMMVSGKDSLGVSVLRLWKSENTKDFDLSSFAQGDYVKAMKEYNDAEIISKILYPADNHYEGKALRLKQQYFLVSASLHSIISDHIRYHGSIDSLDKYVSIHINDTHPALVIPELVRVLMDEYNYSFEDAWEKTKKTVNYTNHTILQEALEKWYEDLVRTEIPRIYIILKQIDNNFRAYLKNQGLSYDELRRITIIEDNQIKMANLCVVASGKINGVSALHTNIIKNQLFNDYYKLNPDKFINITNGIAYRRWLCESNPKLCALIERLIGPDFYKDASKLKDLLKYKDDDNVLNEIGQIKFENKCEFADHVFAHTNVRINPNTRFDVQVKRLHEYKRQLLNVLKIVYLITILEENPGADIPPQTFIFGAKAAPTYYDAKDVINLICSIASDTQKYARLGNKVNVVFMENYDVTLAEKLFPASDISEQISLAGKEASGTSNMKFMINGALTLGTLDGANVEITENVGEDNIFLFGMKANEVNDLWKRGYNPKVYYESNPKIKKVLDRLDFGFNGKSFHHIKEYLINRYPVADPYMCLADFDSYLQAYDKICEAYKDRRKWNQMALINIANAGTFSSDRAINQYAKEIWNIKPVIDK